MPMPNLEFDLAHSSVELLRRERLFVSGQMDGLDWLVEKMVRPGPGEERRGQPPAAVAIDGS